MQQSDHVRVLEARRDLFVTRGQDVTHLMSMIFFWISLIPTMVLAVLALLQHNTYEAVLAAGFGGGTLLQGLAWYLVQRIPHGWSALLVTLGILLIAMNGHLLWIQSHGLDGIGIALFAVYAIPVGLSGIMNGPVLMFSTTMLIMLYSIITVIFLPGFGLTAYPGVAPWAIVVIIAGVDWIIALLVHASSVLYSRALEKLQLLQIAYQQAMRLDGLKDQFIDHVNHELRTPIMALQGSIDFLLMAHTTMDADRIHALLTQSGRNADRLVTMLSNILDARKIDPDQLRLTPVVCRLQPMMAAIMESLDPLHTHQTTILIQEDIKVLADPTALEQILTNFVANALKYGGEPGQITITATTKPSKDSVEANARTQHNTIEIAVSDTGPGIPAEEADLLFRRFVRLPRDMASNIPGSGLGLYLTKVLAEAMGGSVGLESPGRAGSGSTFWVLLPQPEIALTIPKLQVVKHR